MKPEPRVQKRRIGPVPQNLTPVWFHSSAFPDAVRRDLLGSIRSRQINHRFLYEGVSQTQKWLALHEACSPARTDRDCMRIYDEACKATVSRASTGAVHLFGLGCGGGQKDLRLLSLLKRSGRKVAYSPVDVSAAMVLVAREAVLKVTSAEKCFPIVMDLARAPDLAQVLRARTFAGHARLCTFFGMLPNFEPGLILPRLAQALGPRNGLLMSANLAPGTDYEEGVKRILSQYDNPWTRDWLAGFLKGLGIQAEDGRLHFEIETQARVFGLKRIVAYFEFGRERSIGIDQEMFEFKSGDSIRVFFSYRHTAAKLEKLLHGYGLRVLDQWVTKSEEEGVFLVGF